MGIPAGIIGARLDYVISHLGQFSSFPRAVALWNGGLALFGGLIAGTLTATVVLWRRGAPSAVSWMPPHRPSHWPSRSAGSATCC